MAEKNVKSRIVHKHDVEANWSLAENFIPKQGELIVYDIDENYNYERVKIGDGITNVSSLPFINQNITIDATLTQEGIAADAKAVGDRFDSLDTIIATDSNEDGNIELRAYIPETEGPGFNVEIDSTLSVEGAAADAKAVGDEINRLSGEIENAGSITIDLEGADDGEANTVNADTLGGISAEEYATENFVTDKIAEAQLSGGEVDLTGYATEAYVSEAVNNHKVDRAHLFEDALYSPIRLINTASDNIVSTDLGKTLRTEYNLDISITLTQEVSQTMPVGAEIAIAKWSSNTYDVFLVGDGVRFANSESGINKDATFKMSAPYSMIAMKKIVSSASNGDGWLLTGNVEVV